MYKQYPRYRMGTKPFMYSIYTAPKNVFRKNHRNIINKSAHSIHNLTETHFVDIQQAAGLLVMVPTTATVADVLSHEPN
jgi:hypothetical protein